VKELKGLIMKIQTTIQKWGNSLAVRITGPLKTIPHFSANMPIEIEVTERGLTIHPFIAPKKRKLLLFKEFQLLKGLTPKKAHADEIVDIHHDIFTACRQQLPGQEAGNWHF
jgi:antitoxin MazE